MSLLTTLRDTIEKMEKIHQVHILKIFTKYVYFYRPKLIKIIKDFVKNIIFIQKSEKERIDITPLWITDNKTSVYFHFLMNININTNIMRLRVL